MKYTLPFLFICLVHAIPTPANENDTKNKSVNAGIRGIYIVTVQQGKSLRSIHIDKSTLELNTMSSNALIKTESKNDIEEEEEEESLEGKCNPHRPG